MGLSYSQPACRSAYAGDVHQLFTVLSEDPSQLNVQEPDSGDTPLIAACRRGNLRVVQYLLDNGADVHVTNQKQRTALHYVSRRTFSLLDYLVMAVLMPVLLIGYFIMVSEAWMLPGRRWGLIAALTSRRSVRKRCWVNPIVRVRVRVRIRGLGLEG
ncbi:ankyrin repeat domain-containing protein 22 isoform X2 [Takifugu flavidus]|uniref:ankyrin repeat domain-containing protein 22 isoform X2 n=1 Tax=Takifugu flavidus TaxID=433684 RepID=UPI0025446B7C|nr:ankyrin repeat domain-containing protein 22 isoform X2 [Takifugu flavidus]